MGTNGFLVDLIHNFNRKMVLISRRKMLRECKYQTPTCSIYYLKQEEEKEEGEKILSGRVNSMISQLCASDNESRGMGTHITALSRKGAYEFLTLYCRIITNYIILYKYIFV